jgi:twitching motility protein PilT
MPQPVRISPAITDLIATVLKATLKPAGNGEDVHGSLPTDWHFAPGKRPYIRTAGTLRMADTLPVWPIAWDDEASAAYLAQLARDEIEDLSIEWEGWRFRLHTQIAIGNDGRRLLVAKLRRIPLQLPSVVLPEAFVECCSKPRGIVLVSGPTGSGKSTTLAKVVKHHLAPGVNVECYENPIEYVHESTADRLIGQYELRRDFSSYAQSMRHVLRMDPDVLIPTELNDGETFRSAISAAETGHLIIATMHLSTTPGVVSRIIHATADTDGKGAIANATNNAYHEVLAGAFQAVLCQQLVPLKGGGRVAAFELLVRSDTVQTIISQSDHQAMRRALEEYVRATGVRYGSFTLEHSLAVLVSLGRISETAAAECAGRQDLMKRQNELVTQMRNAPSKLFDLYRNV